ncbi:uncharacterized protein B0I36DRAFT_349843 [Microdochium trichocladiopsis]|uniref:Uncharacterized protein n=1 Tax=Microdochium trichocladiopsis TaxID=1682393 RepID=A0A9P9BPA4_9PEZI|nr:uncharacterized protein B0I36DRAFT_349843 [Microdochium trichocladiopsis]KAH7028855.1 hypothetical protein B0I36DRAFT_349843 [Microdochium trichocladiopsis]
MPPGEISAREATRAGDHIHRCAARDGRHWLPVVGPGVESHTDPPAASPPNGANQIGGCKGGSLSPHLAPDHLHPATMCNYNYETTSCGAEHWNFGVASMISLTPSPHPPRCLDRPPCGHYAERLTPGSPDATLGLSCRAAKHTRCNSREWHDQVQLASDAPRCSKHGQSQRDKRQTTICAAVGPPKLGKVGPHDPTFVPCKSPNGPEQCTV